MNRIGASVSPRSMRSGLRGWPLVYIRSRHTGAARTRLTVGAIVIFADPQVAGLSLFVPLPVLLFYVITNIVIALDTAVVLVLEILAGSCARTTD